MLNEAFWGSRIVFFGEADHGKSTLMGYLYAESQEIDMNRHKKYLSSDLGTEYKDDYLYSSLINPIVSETHGGLSRFSSKSRHLRDFVVDAKGTPLLITMIDTPGHADFLRHQEYGATRGRIGIFCLYIKSILDDNFDGSVFERTQLWFVAHPNLKLIIALTQFDRENYSEEAYATAKAKIERYLKPENIKAIIPVGIDFKTLSGENILRVSEHTPWYQGAILIDAIQEQWFEIANQIHNEYLRPRNLVLSVEREYPHPLSNAGKIWRVHVENGVLNIGDEIKLTSVEVKPNLKASSGMLIPFVTAVLKEFRMDVCVDEDDDDEEEATAFTGSALSINLKDCYDDNGNKIKKAQISTTRQTIGLLKNEPFSLINRFWLRFEALEDILWLKNLNQEINLLFFGRSTPANIVMISEDETEVLVELLSNRRITIPDNRQLRDLDIFKKIIVRVPAGPRFLYLPARIVFASDPERATIGEV